MSANVGPMPEELPRFRDQAMTGVALDIPEGAQQNTSAISLFAEPRLVVHLCPFSSMRFMPT